MYFIIDLGLVFLIFGILVAVVVAGGTLVLDKIIGFLFGSMNVGSIILFIIVAVINIIHGFSKDSKSGVLSRIVGTIGNIFGSMLRCIICVIYMLSVMDGFLSYMEKQQIFIAAIGIVLCGIVFLIFLWFSAGIDYLNFFVLTEKISMCWVGAINVILSILYFIAGRAFLINVFDVELEELFAKQQWLYDFIVNFDLSALFTQ